MKKYIIVTLAIFLVLVWFFNDDVVEIRDSSIHSATKNNSISFVSSSSNLISSISDSQPSQNISAINVSDEVSEKMLWRNSRGIFSDEDLVDYEGFKLDKLEELANKGDLKAIKVLCEYELFSGNSKRLAELMDLGVVHGSLGAMRFIGIQKKQQYLISRQEEDALEAFSYLEFQGKRGDLFIKSKIPVDYKIFNFYPTQEQAEYIDRRSDELMADFEKRRKEMGLPPFDNSTLASDRELFEVP